MPDPRIAYAANPAHCKACGAALPYEKRKNTYCDLSCFGRANAAALNDLNHSKKVITYCSCGNEKKRANTYCDACIERRVYDTRSQTFDAILSPVSRRKFLIRERGHRCERCTLTQWRGQPIALELHHIDGDAGNNTRENLQVLCPNCHAQTAFYKGAGRRNPYARRVRHTQNQNVE